jgi:hypothetical protein
MASAVNAYGISRLPQRRQASLDHYSRDRKAMTTYISTWMYAENAGEGGVYPQVGGSTASSQAQAIYWRCVYCFFLFAHRFVGSDPSIRLALFTNVPVLPEVGIVDLGAELERLGVYVYCVPYNWKPDALQKLWFNQYYLFDILESFDNLLQDDDCCFVVDCDALIVRGFSPVVDALRSSGALLIDVGIGADEEVSGLTRTRAAEVAERLTGVRHPEPQPYFGGEFYGLDKKTLHATVALARSIYAINNDLARRGQPYFSDEAHFFSFLMGQLGHRRANANPFARRIWTSQKYNNTRRSDLDLCLWHVPSEKLYGLEQIFSDLATGAVDLAALGDAEVRHYAARKLGVGGVYVDKYIGHVLRALRRKAVSAGKALRRLRGARSELVG